MANQKRKPSQSTRAYRSPLREAQAAETRARIVMAAEDFLRETGEDRLRIAAIAKRAGVSTAAVYKHFSDDDALLLAVIDEHRRRTAATLFESELPVDRLYEVPLRSFPLLDADREIAVIGAHSIAFSRVRAAGRETTKRSLNRRLAPIAKGLRADELDAVSGAIQLLSVPRAWYWLEEHWGLPPETAARAAAWATRTLVDALRNDPKSFRSVPRPSKLPKQKKEMKP